MIIYATENTIRDYNVKMPDELRYPVSIIAQSVIARESGDDLLKWGCAAFEIDGVKCLQLTNFAGLLTVFLIKWEESDLHNLSQYLLQYLYDIYSGDSEAERCIGCMLQETQSVCFAKLIDGGVKTAMDSIRHMAARDGNRFFDYISDGVMRTREINRDMNFDWYTSGTIDNEHPGEYFRKILTERYGDTELIHFPLWNGRCSCGRKH